MCLNMQLLIHLSRGHIKKVIDLQQQQKNNRPRDKSVSRTNEEAASNAMVKGKHAIISNCTLVDRMVVGVIRPSSFFFLVSY